MIHPPLLKGIKVHAENPFQFDFILDKGDGNINASDIPKESEHLIKYFLASLTIPEKEWWVNLSPYEHGRLIPESFGSTAMGRDLLAEDYILKKITASLLRPEDETGKKFWKRVYEEAARKFGTTDIPIDTFNKVWIIPEKAEVSENAASGTAYVTEARLTVMLEQDYLALQKKDATKQAPAATREINALSSRIVREIILPELIREVNENKNFIRLRQIFHSLILATWYKKKIHNSLLVQVYADKRKVDGVTIDDPRETERIYQRYLEAFYQGACNYVREEQDPVSREVTTKKYFSGGASFQNTSQILRFADHAMGIVNVAGRLVLIGALLMTSQASAEERGSLMTSAKTVRNAYLEGFFPSLQLSLAENNRRFIRYHDFHNILSGYEEDARVGKLQTGDIHTEENLLEAAKAGNHYASWLLKITRPSIAPRIDPTAIIRHVSSPDLDAHTSALKVLTTLAESGNQKAISFLETMDMSLLRFNDYPVTDIDVLERLLANGVSRAASAFLDTADKEHIISLHHLSDKGRLHFDEAAVLRLINRYRRTLKADSRDTFFELFSLGRLIVRLHVLGSPHVGHFVKERLDAGDPVMLRSTIFYWPRERHDYGVTLASIDLRKVDFKLYKANTIPILVGLVNYHREAREIFEDLIKTMDAEDLHEAYSNYLGNVHDLPLPLEQDHLLRILRERATPAILYALNKKWDSKKKVHLLFSDRLINELVVDYGNGNIEAAEILSSSEDYGNPLLKSFLGTLGAARYFKDIDAHFPLLERLVIWENQDVISELVANIDSNNYTKQRLIYTLLGCRDKPSIKAALLGKDLDHFRPDDRYLYSNVVQALTLLGHPQAVARLGSTGLAWSLQHPVNYPALLSEEGNVQAFGLLVKAAVDRDEVVVELKKLDPRKTASLFSMFDIRKLKHKPALMKLFALRGNRQAMEYAEAHGLFTPMESGLLKSASFESPEFQEQVKKAKTFLERIARGGIHQLVEKLGAFNEQHANKYLKDFVLAVLVGSEQEVGLFSDYREFMESATDVMLSTRFDLFSKNPTAYSDMLFTWPLFLHARDIDDIYGIIWHEVAHCYVKRSIEGMEHLGSKDSPADELLADVLGSSHFLRGVDWFISKETGWQFCPACSALSRDPRILTLLTEPHELARGLQTIFLLRTADHGLRGADMLSNMVKIKLKLSGIYHDKITLQDFFLGMVNSFLAQETGKSLPQYPDGVKSMVEKTDYILSYYSPFLDSKYKQEPPPAPLTPRTSAATGVSGNTAAAPPEPLTWKTSVTGDNAMTDGGIDLQVGKAMSIKTTGERIKGLLAQEQLEKWESSPGCIPMITGIQPLTSLQDFLGTN